MEAAYAMHAELTYPLYNLGFLYLKLGELGKARVHFQRFLAREPAGERAERVRRALAAMKD